MRSQEEVLRFSASLGDLRRSVSRGSGGRGEEGGEGKGEVET